MHVQERCYSSKTFVIADVLLCHDDELEGRRIAFILYLVPPWEKNDGGTLDLYSTDGKSSNLSFKWMKNMKLMCSLQQLTSNSRRGIKSFPFIQRSCCTTKMCP